jgi:hypothetical protein
VRAVSLRAEGLAYRRHPATGAPMILTRSVFS